jgi:hypothetical protein
MITSAPRCSRAEASETLGFIATNGRAAARRNRKRGAVWVLVWMNYPTDWRGTYIVGPRICTDMLFKATQMGFNVPGRWL